MLITIKRDAHISTPSDMYELLKSVLYSKHKFDYEKEHFFAIIISRNNRAKFIDEISIGNLNSTIVSSREVFRFAILKGAEAIIVAHNHPSGNLTPSDLDRTVTDMLVKAGNVVGIKVMDSLIITKNGYFSFLEKGLME